MSSPPKMQAVRTVDVHQSNVELVDTPKPGQGEILICTKAVTLNPTDWKHVAFISPSGVTVGCDFAGIVEGLGPGVSNGLKKGDRVSGFVHGGKYPNKGSFAEFLTAKAAGVMKIPDALSDAEAASMGIAGETAVQALFQRLNVKAPSSSITSIPQITKDSPKLLVWAGSTSVGQYAIQLGTIAGYYVITTASPKNHKLVKSLGAQEAHDYKDESVPEAISKAHPDLNIALDCISENGTQSFCARSLGTSGGKIAVLLAPDKNARELRNDVQIIHTLIYSSLGDEFSYGKRVYDRAEVATDFEWMKLWLDGDKGLLHHLFAKGLLKSNKIKHMDGGIQSIHEGMKYMRESKVSAEKLAYTISA
ncbi:GroES-like protein [Tilletiaria anomala UBC 951]|uniref:GroES-like protein n=1 Tax=Tilletiaria anomala (strain ATCC 24038 / CBS 436.72 / UBC 951) TaxID=1037660 RepID=A0A066WFR1_TILAU|nr:GroES-like protein [Tilletiaria anomala UBC 951]KDN52641.1 GroES-like protein [Tilletiaria anomala UBC 951]